jgi:hypothetical protein
MTKDFMQTYDRSEYKYDVTENSDITPMPTEASNNVKFSGLYHSIMGEIKLIRYPQ